jgi:hypothetical protein
VTACTETDDLLVEIGVTQLRLLDSDLEVQSIDDPERTIQAARWKLSEATLTIGGRDVNLLFPPPPDTSLPHPLFFLLQEEEEEEVEEECIFTDTAVVPPNAEGPCKSGVILGADEDVSISASLRLTFTMDVRRAAPVNLALDPRGDFDADGVPNAADICPYAYDPSQEDFDGDGLGDTCSTIDAFTGTALADADGDGWPDSYDNCVWLPNSDQANNLDTDTDAIPNDAIGDRCTEQKASINSQADVTIVRDIGFTQHRNEVNYLLVDFNSDSALRCDWSAPACDLDISRVEICVKGSVSQCP